MKPLATRIYSSQVLDRVVKILDCFGPERTDLRLVELAAATGLHKSTLYRLLEAMRAHRLIGFDETSASWHLGMKLFEMGSMAIERLALDKHAHPILDRLADVSGETAHLCVLDGSDVVYIAKVECTRTLRIPSAVGQRNPAYCTGVGKAILAHLAPPQLAAYIAETPLRPFTKRTLTSAGELRANLRQIVAQGYAIDDQEREDGVRCVAAPVRDHGGRVIAAISIAGPTMRVTKEKVTELAAHVMRAANEIAAKLGYAMGAGNGARNGTAARSSERSLPRLNGAVR
jgi:IclR family transcriptional regulator, KDG regulon repressor